MTNAIIRQLVEIESELHTLYVRPGRRGIDPDELRQIKQVLFYCLRQCFILDGTIGGRE